ncbi:hypothetical protein MBLNU230_g6553t1 [Neophaeotheca triangularis]
MLSLSIIGLAAGSALAAPFSYPEKAHVPIGYEASTLTARQDTGLNNAAVNAGKLFFGTATELPTDDAAYMDLLSNTADFGQLTPANAMKWDSTEPSRDQFSFSGSDEIAELAASNGQRLRCHALVWYNQLPSWVSEGGFDNATLIEVMTNHITNVVEHFKGQCYAWDVVNEALSDNGDGSLRSNIFLDTIGEAYIPIAFAAAAAADPDALLYYNDYSIEDGGAKSQGAQDIVRLVQSYGAKIDGVGLQSHFIVGSTASTEAQISNMQAFAELGVEVAITELDIRADTPISETDLQTQAEDYASTVEACLSVDACVGITLWDFTDKYSWIPNTFSGEGDALPWDENLENKPAYNAILEALQGGSSSPAVTADTAFESPVATSVSSLPASEEGIMSIQTQVAVATSAVAYPSEPASPAFPSSEAVSPSSTIIHTGFVSPTVGYTFASSTGIAMPTGGTAMPTGTGIYPTGTGVSPTGTGASSAVVAPTGANCPIEYVYV